MAERSLEPQDRVSVFAVDCKLIRSALNLPATPAGMQKAVADALSAPTLHGVQQKPACGRSVHLWDAAVYAVRSLSHSPGRKVVLVVSNGNDHRSHYTWNALKQFADEESVAVFAMRDYNGFAGDYGISRINMGLSGMYFAPGNATEDNYNELCQNTGGLIFTVLPRDLVPSLQRFVAMLRGRYILEFPRPNDSTPGSHSIDITIPDARDFIVTAGVSVALPETGRDEDPTTVRSAPSPAVMGKRRPLGNSN